MDHVEPAAQLGEEPVEVRRVARVGGDVSAGAAVPGAGRHDHGGRVGGPVVLGEPLVGGE
ncbi:hypothetical protein JM949_30530, partial [Micromonospora sp. STR1s_6]|nr:hypothetical protein [Micromonospora tarensis]